ncbi:MAG: hypothetical protein MUF21_15105, partial [Gemmatimonadaceae bacterium]|nr:hypothetical protein [Gemmatimonadaceae bacterium]
MLRRLVALTLVTATALHAQIIGGPGPTSNFMPFGGFSNVGTPPATIYQQLFSAESWSAPVTFTGVRFFRASNAGAYRSGTYSVFLSTSSRTVQGSNTLSITDFDSNRGADNTLIGTLTLGGNAEATLTFTGGSFSYNPSMGNLLLD